jgi:hypothetical protein
MFVTKTHDDSRQKIAQCRGFVASHQTAHQLVLQGQYQAAGRIYHQTLQHMRRDLLLNDTLDVVDVFTKVGYSTTMTMSHNNCVADSLFSIHFIPRSLTKPNFESIVVQESSLSALMPTNAYELCDCLVSIDFDNVQEPNQTAIEEIYTSMFVASLFNLAMTYIWSCSTTNSKPKNHHLLHRAFVLLRLVLVLLSKLQSTVHNITCMVSTLLETATVNNLGYLHAIDCQFDELQKCLVNMAHTLVSRDFAKITQLHHGTPETCTDDGCGLWSVYLVLIQNVHFLYHRHGEGAPMA